jgi:hypothetical protein
VRWPGPRVDGDGDDIRREVDERLTLKASTE